MQRPAIADYPPGAETPARRIPDFELVWMLRGRATLVGAEELTIEPGQLLLIPPAARHAIAWDPERPCRHGYVHFDRELLGGVALAQPLRVQMTGHDPLAGACSYLLWLGQLPGDAWSANAEATLRYLLQILVTGPLPTERPSAELLGPIATAVHHVAEAWAEPPLSRITTADLAAAAAISRGYLNRLWRAAFGLTPATALEGARLARVEAMLRRTDLSIEVIAHSCGFADPSHLSHRFTATHGTSPRTYRASLTTGPSALDHAGVRRLTHLLWGQDPP